MKHTINSDLFWSKVLKTDGCWYWTASKFKHGYGCFGVKDESGKTKIRYAHRLSWELANGEIPEQDRHHGVVVMHTCDNKACVNPEHLVLGSQLDNVRDCIKKNRRRYNGQRGEKNAYAKLDAARVKIIKYIGNSLSQQRLADGFGVEQTNIGHILRGKTWSHVEIVK